MVKTTCTDSGRPRGETLATGKLTACCRWLVVWLWLGGLGWGATPDAGPPPAPLSAEFLAGLGPRTPGSPGNLALEQAVAEQFARGGTVHGALGFAAPRWVPGATTLVLPDQSQVRLLPCHPGLFRPGNFPSREFRGPLVYLGRGTNADLTRLRGTPLAGAVGLLEFDSGDAWMRFLRFGIRGFIFIGQDDADRFDAVSKVPVGEVALPRFWVSAADGARLRAHGEHGGDVVITGAPSRWESAALHDLWAFYPGTDPTLQQRVAVILAPLDANGLVPDLAVGAQAGANLQLLMQLADEFRARPPGMSVLLVAVNAHTQKFLGERVLAWHLVAPTELVEARRDALAAEVQLAEARLRHYRELRLDPPDAATAELLVRWRTLTDHTMGKELSVKEPLVTAARRDLNQVKLARRRAERDATLAPAEREQRLATIEREYERQRDVLTLFNAVGVQTTLTDIQQDPAKLALLRRYVTDVITDHEQGALLNQAELARDVANGALREALTGRSVAFVITLDLTWNSRRLGFCSYSGGIPLAHSWPRTFGVATSRLAEPALDPQVVTWVDTLTMIGGRTQDQYFFPLPESAIRYFHAYGCPAFSLRHVEADSGAAFLPTDTFERLPKETVAAQTAAVQRLLRAWLSDAELTAAAPPLKNAGWSTLVRLAQYDRFSPAVLPQLPVPGAALLLYDGVYRQTPLVPVVGGDVMNAYLSLSDARALASVISLDTGCFSNAYALNADQTTITAVLDAGDAATRVSTTLGPGPALRCLALFEAVELPLYERVDPSLLSFWPITFETLYPFTFPQEAMPRQFGLTSLSSLSAKASPRTLGPTSLFLVPGDRVKLITGNKRVVLNATPAAPDGLGIPVEAGLGPDFAAAAAHDLGLLNQQRLGQMWGVTNHLAETFCVRGQAAGEQAQAASARRDHLGYLRAVYEALGSEAKAYAQVSGLNNDLLKAVVFYMALLLPFCFFLQKLLFSYVRIEAQIAAFTLLFGATFCGFRLIHPAFRLARCPEMVLVAFTMGVLGLLVIILLHRRFEGEMQLLFRAGLGLDTSSVGHSTVSQNALLIGVQNMKRRRIRTALTTTTIVLITFAMLAFSSVSTTLHPTMVPLNLTAPYHGLCYQMPGNLRMDEASAQVVQDLFATEAPKPVVRRWLLPPQPLPLEAAGGQRALLEAVLGLPVAEQELLGPLPLLPGGRFFSSDDAAEAVLPLGAAAALGLAPSQAGRATVRFQGREYTVVGLLDNEKFRARRDLNQRPLLPVKSVRHELRQSDWDASLALDPVGAESDLSFVDPSALLILPVETAKRCGAAPFSVSLRFADDAPLWPLAERLLTATEAKFYLGSRTPFIITPGQPPHAAGTSYIGSGYRTTIGGLARLLIPLLIAGTIILNTMLGSLYERKHEIAVYNAIGLNPTHIMLFFLAEAFVYSILGAVGGYLIGQALALGLSRSHLVTGINLNFSSLTVIYVICFTIGITLLSTLYPALVAVRVAVPSGKRRWALPSPRGNRMEVVFPFIYQPHLAPGVMAYLEEYLGRFTEASLGDLIVERTAAQRGLDAQGRACFVLSYRVALAPFDLGVTEQVTFTATYDDHVQSYRVTLHLDRLSGQDTNWVTTNQPFLERLRSYLLHWRNLDHPQHERYIADGTALFAAAPAPAG